MQTSKKRREKIVQMSKKCRINILRVPIKYKVNSPSKILEMLAGNFEGGKCSKCISVL